jgi:hypothetical protein
MYKIIVISIIITSMLFLCSCSLGRSRTEMLNKDDSDKKSDARLEQVTEAIKNKDKDTLKSMFSKQALDKAADFDGSMDHLFEFFQGKVTSWERNGGPSVYETTDHGHKTKKFNSMYYVNTDKQKYIFYLIEWTVDTDHPDNVGLYTLRVIKAEDRDTQFLKYQDMKPGISCSTEK